MDYKDSRSATTQRLSPQGYCWSQQETAMGWSHHFWDASEDPWTLGTSSVSVTSDGLVTLHGLMTLAFPSALCLERCRLLDLGVGHGDGGGTSLSMTSEWSTHRFLFHHGTVRHRITFPFPTLWTHFVQRHVHLLVDCYRGLVIHTEGMFQWVILATLQLLLQWAFSTQYASPPPPPHTHTHTHTHAMARRDHARATEEHHCGSLWWENAVLDGAMLGSCIMGGGGGGIRFSHHPAWFLASLGGAVLRCAESYFAVLSDAVMGVLYTGETGQLARPRGRFCHAHPHHIWIGRWCSGWCHPGWIKVKLTTAWPGSRLIISQ